MERIFLFFLLAGFPAFSQTVYQPHEVEKAAEPSGGLPFFNQFIASNLRIPFSRAVNGINGKVFVTGIVEPDGSMTKLEISRGIDSLCNQEAIRVLSLYKAWKPALVKGESVRQSVVLPVIFRTLKNPAFDSTRNVFFSYLDDEFKPTTDPGKYEFRSVLPVDQNGYVSNDVVVEQLRSKKWKPVVTIPFQKKEIWHKLGNTENRMDSVKAYQISARDESQASFASEAIFQMENNKLLVFTEFNAQGKASHIDEYYLSGTLKKTNILSDSLDTEIRWYENGQIQNVIEKTVVTNVGQTSETTYINMWDADGVQRLKNGDGYWRSVGVEWNGKVFIEEGNLIAGKKNGIWRGKMADSTLLFQEVYEIGAFQEGFSMVNGEKVIYDVPVKHPTFVGGINQFYKFLGTNIMYPINAHKRGATGRVLLSFVVCEDGSLCDYKVDKSAGREFDREALRVVKKSNGFWQPGEIHGKPVRVKYNLPINFQ